MSPVRPATTDDLPFMWEMLYEAIHWPEGSPDPKPSREEVFAANEMRRYLEGWGREGDAAFIVVDGDEQVGAVWHRQRTSEEPGYGFVDEETPEITAAVLPEYRGRGVGSAMLNALVKSARASGFGGLSLSMDRTNRAVGLYERYGFREMETRATDILMKLDLREDINGEGAKL